MTIDIQMKAYSSQRRAAESRARLPRFGKDFVDLMAHIHHSAERGWHQAEILPFGPLLLSPAAKALHYGLEIFEGHKAYRWPDNQVALFRPDNNARRMNRSAVKMGLPELPEELQQEVTERLVDAVRDWVPDQPGSSLYLRPTMLATEGALGITPATEHLFFVIAGPAGPYFPGGFASIAVNVERGLIRAAAGGVGDAKTGGNYAAGMAAKARARAAGCDDVLFLDATLHRYIEELSGMNVFVVEGERLLTPPLGGTILPGITRRSLIELAPDLGLAVEERPLAIDDLLDGIRDGRFSEMMAVGTAAVVTPIGALRDDGETVELGDGEPGPVTRKLYDTITGIQYGRLPDHRGWMRVVEPALSVSKAV